MKSVKSVWGCVAGVGFGLTALLPLPLSPAFHLCLPLSLPQIPFSLHLPPLLPPSFQLERSPIFTYTYPGPPPRFCSDRMFQNFESLGRWA